MALKRSLLLIITVMLVCVVNTYNAGVVRSKRQFMDPFMYGSMGGYPMYGGGGYGFDNFAGSMLGGVIGGAIGSLF
ncbi:Aquaporin-8 [Trichinella spiralis]|uniref:Aquaporin-8 n=1 Tax=Trichinella spiralis TaxID=6334 RepID=A0ABR3KWQ0_TRISP